MAVQSEMLLRDGLRLPSNSTWKMILSQLLYERKPKASVYIFINFQSKVPTQSKILTNSQLFLISHLISLYSETCLKQPLKNRQNKGLKAMW